MSKDNLKEIKELPLLEDYPALKDALENRELVIFIGAGVSRLLGCKSWDDLATDLLKKCLELKLIDYYEFEEIKKYPEQKKKISIVYELLKENNAIDNFYNIFEKALKPEKNINEKTIYTDIARLADTFVTTNADECFDNRFVDTDLIYDFTQEDKVRPYKLYHIHGMQKHKDSLVFTVNQYLNKYNDYTETKFLLFLEDLFCNHTVLFIGYGLSEFELLDYLTLKARTSKSSYSHYALMPYFSSKKKIADYDQLYYQSLHIQIIPYSIDKNGYNQLEKILEQWSFSYTYLSMVNVEMQTLFSKKELTVEDCNRIIEILIRDESFSRLFLNLCEKNPRFAVSLIDPLYENVFLKFHHFYYSLCVDFLLIFIKYVNTASIKDIDEKLKILKIIIKEIMETTDDNDNDLLKDKVLRLAFSLDEQFIEKFYFDYAEKIFSEESNDRIMFSYSLSEQIFPKVIQFKNTEWINRMIEILFSVKIDMETYPYIFSKVYASRIREITDNYIAKMYEKLDLQLVLIVVNNILKIPNEIRYSYTIRNCDDDLPVFEDHYMKTLFNTLIWLVKNSSKYSYKEILNILRNKDTQLAEKLEEILARPPEKFKSLYEKMGLYDPPLATEDEIQSFSIENIMKFIQENKSTDLIEKNRVDSVIKKWVIQYADINKKLLKYFVDVETHIANSVIAGLYDVLREKKTKSVFEVTDILEFFACMLPKLFECKKIESEDECFSSFCLQNMCSFVSEYIQNNMDNIEENIFLKMKEIILAIYENLNPENQKDESIFSYNVNLLNTENGICYNALFFMYAYCKERQKAYDAELRVVFKELIESKVSLLFLVLFGETFEYFFYFDRQWTEHEIKTVFNSANKLVQKAFWAGYFYTRFNISVESYRFFKIAGLYDKLKELKLTDSEYYQRMAELCCVMYLKGEESIDGDNSVINYFLNMYDPKFFEMFIRSFMVRKTDINKNKDKYQPKVIEIWQALTEKLKEHLSDNDFEMCVINIMQFVEMVSKIDKTIYDLFSFSIRTIPTYRIDHFILPKFLEIYKNDKASRENICNIIIYFAEHKTYFSDYGNSFTELFKLMCTENRNQALKIASMYQANNEAKYMNVYNEYE